MARRDRDAYRRPEAPQPSPVAPQPAAASPSAAAMLDVIEGPCGLGALLHQAAPLPPPAPPVEPPAAPPAAPLRLVALTSIHGGRIYAPGDEIPASIAAQLSEGEHWHRAP